MMALESNVYEEHEDKKAAVEILQEIIAAECRNHGQVSASQANCSSFVSEETFPRSGGS